MENKNLLLRKEIDGLLSNYTDWEYIENILEALEDVGCLTRIGKRFRHYIWKRYIEH